MEKELYEKYADKLLSAMKREGLMNKEVAEIFGVPASYMSDMRKHPEKVSGLFMEKIRTWSISGKPLREYKLPTSPDTEVAEINQQQANEAREKAEMKFRSKLPLRPWRGNTPPRLPQQSLKVSTPRLMQNSR